jgi:hypothetical protein
MINRCGTCQACQIVTATQKVLMPNPPFTHANQATVNAWNMVLRDNPCNRGTN